MIDSNLCTFLEWDTTFFGKRIARVKSQTLTSEQANKIDLWCERNAIDCLYFLADSNHAPTVQIAEDHHYRQVDIRMTYEQKLTNIVQQFDDAIVPTSFALDVAKPDDVPTLLDIASNTFTHSRFYYDKYFSYEKSNDLYRIWIQNSVTTDFADRVIVFREDGVPKGFVTCSLDKLNKVGVISLIGIAEDVRGKKLGTRLIYQALDYFQQAGMETGQVGTQARNIGANRLYQNCGFRIKNVALWYHKWFSPPR